MSRARAFFQRHPAIRDALLWAIPAIAFGFLLRALLLACQPYAFWSSDAESYYAFAHRLLSEGIASIPQKRRYLYPLLVLPVKLLPGAPLQWIALLQHAMGLLTIIPLAYAVRKIFVGWKWWVIPATILYAGVPVILWYEHELLSEAFFFASIVWTFAAWAAWCGRLRRGDRAPVVWWICFACLALCVLTKPAARFLWPGLLVGMIYVRAWRFLRWPQWLACAALFGVMLTVGERGQAARLLYSSAFPLTVLDSPRHADLKAEIAPMVRASRARLDYYYLEDDGPKHFLRGDYREGNFPAWQALDKKDVKGLTKAMRDMALEALFTQPHLLLYIAVQRAVGSLNWTEFKLNRFEPGYQSANLRDAYDSWAKKGEARKLSQFASAYGVFGPVESPPPFSEIQNRVEPAGREAPARWLAQYVQTVTPWGVFVADPEGDGFKRTLWQMTPTPLGWWLILGCVLAWALPWLRGTLGVWLAVAIGYAITVHLLGSGSARFFAAAWPPLLLALFAPLDGLYSLISRRFSPP